MGQAAGGSLDVRVGCGLLGWLQCVQREAVGGEAGQGNWGESLGFIF